MAQWVRLKTIDGILHRRFEVDKLVETYWQIVMPRELRFDYTKTVHGGCTGGHLGKKRTAALVKARAYWPRWSEDVAVTLKRCEPCARYHRGAAPRLVGLKPFLAGKHW